MDWFVVTSALSLAAMYGLLGIGISLTWSSIGMLNLAHGFTFAAAGYGAWWASKNLVKAPTSGTDALIVGGAGIGIGVVAGLCVGLIAFLPLHDRPNFPIRSLIATLAISLAGTQVFLLWFGPLNKPLPKVFSPVARALDRPKLEFGPISITWDRVGAIVCATLLCVIVLTWVRLSRRGIQMRAMMQNPEGAALVGVSVRSTGMLVMGICGGMAGLSAVLLSSTFFVSPSAGTQPLAKGLVIALLGGLGSVPGAVIASVLVGFTEALTAKYFGTGYTLFAQYVLVFGVLIVRPRGIGGLLAQVREWSAEAPRETVARDAPRQQLVGRRRLLLRIPVNVDRTFRRRRWPWSKTSVVSISGRFNPKTLGRERFVSHKAPLWWLVFLVLTLAIPLIAGTDKILTIASTFTIYASINLMWMLIMGTAGIFSLASLAVTGVAAYTACWMSINWDLPWPLMFPVGAVAGLLVGVIIAIPARRMDGMYYALLTLGVSEICRAYALQARWIGAQSQGSLSGGGGFIPDDIRFTATGQRIGYLAGFLLLLAALATYRLVNGQRLGLLLRASQKEDEAVSESMGIDFQRSRLAVFLISSAALGVIGAFYAGYFRAASLSLFGTDLLLLLFAMIVIGGIGRAEGAVVGTLIVTVIDRYFIDTGAKRILLVAILMLISVLFTRGGAFGLKDQWQELRAKRRSSRRAARSTRRGQVLPEEAPDIHDKSLIYQRRYDHAQREHLKSLINDDLIEEHRRSPTGLHSENLERVMLYFRKNDLAGKYCVYAVEPFKRYRIVALSGLPGVPPRTIDDRIYTTIDDAYHAVFLRRINDLRSR